MFYSWLPINALAAFIKQWFRQDNWNQMFFLLSMYQNSVKSINSEFRAGRSASNKFMATKKIPVSAMENLGRIRPKQKAKRAKIGERGWGVGLL